jgi:hypothetical protein
MKTVYGIESGSYSDYRVHDIYEDRHLAEQICAACNIGPYSDYRVKKFTLIESFDEWTRDRKFIYQVEIIESADGQQKINKISEWRKPNEIHELYAHADKYGDGYYARATSDRGLEQAEKACYDKLAEFKAKKAGIA